MDLFNTILQLLLGSSSLYLSLSRFVQTYDPNQTHSLAKLSIVRTLNQKTPVQTKNWPQHKKMKVQEAFTKSIGAEKPTRC